MMLLEARFVSGSWFKKPPSGLPRHCDDGNLTRAGADPGLCRIGHDYQED